MEQKSTQIKLTAKPIPFPTWEEFNLLAIKTENKMVYRQTFGDPPKSISMLIEAGNIDDPEGGFIIGAITANGGIIRFTKRKGISEEVYYKICEDIEKARWDAINELATPELSVIEKALEEIIEKAPEEIQG